MAVPALGEGPPPSGDDGCELCRRLRRALLEELASRDLASLDEDDLLRRAGVTTGHYGSVTDCFLATYDEVVSQLYERCSQALAESPGWYDRPASTMLAALEYIDSEPGVARLCFLEPSRSPDPRVRARSVAARQMFARLLAGEADDSGVPRLHFEFLVGALHSAASEELLSGRCLAPLAQRMGELAGLAEPVAA